MNSQKQYTDIYNKDRRVPPGIFGKQLQDYQKFVRNYFGIDSGNRELFIWHSTGRGKTMSALTISEPYSRLLLESPELEGFVYIIGSFASIDNFIGELTGEAGNAINGLIPGSNNIYITNQEKEELNRALLKVTDDPQTSHQYNQLYKKYIHNRLKDARYRFYTYQKFINLTLTHINNSLIIIDEAHNLLNVNEYSQMLRNLVEVSQNYKVVLLSATPMFNSPYDIVDFLNLMLRKDEEIKHSDIFVGSKRQELLEDFSQEFPAELKPNGLRILQEKIWGKLSYLTAINDENFPKVIEIGRIPEFLKETKLILVPMSRIQRETYDKFWNESLTQDIKYIINGVTPEGSFDNFEEYFSKHQDSLQLSRLLEIAPKYAECLRNLSEGHKVGKSLVYHSYVNNSGIKFFVDILRHNGYLEYNEKYIRPDARDRKTGLPYESFANQKGKKKEGDEFSAVRFAIIHGDIPQNERAKIIEIYNDKGNLFGEKISILIGSQLLRESVDLKATLHIHILGYQENYSRLKQIIGRGVRYQSHLGLPKELWYVKIYKYCTKASAEELEYVKDEKNYIKMREIEQALRSIAVDCQQNLGYNQSPGSSYKCQGAPATPLDIPDTYRIFFAESEIYDAILFILNMFTEEVGYDYDSFLDLVPFDREIIHGALNRIVNEKMEIPGLPEVTVVRIGNNWFRQPARFIDPFIDINLRSYAADLSEKTDVTDLLRSLVSGREKKIVLDIEKVHSELRESPELYQVILNKYDKLEQTLILEDAIRQYIQASRKIPEEVFLILKAFKRYLIDELEFGKEINSTPFDKFFDSKSWNLKDDGRKFIGHFLGTTLRIYNPSSGKFEDTLKNYMKTHRTRDLKDNPFGVGSLARDLAGNIVFKIRDPIASREVRDLRKLPRGYVCNRVNNKESLYHLLDDLDVPYDPTIRISDLCLIIERELRERQKYNNKNNLDVLWFEDLKF